MKILVLATDYPRPDGYAGCYFIHTRNRYYVQKGIDVSVLSFGTKNDYMIDNVKVFSLNTFRKKIIHNRYDILISHAPNLKNHYLFLKKYDSKFDNIVFFFHGHEVLISSIIYPAPYSYTKNNPITKKIIRDVYDRLKLITWKKYFEKKVSKLSFIFVSNWIYNMFTRFVKLNPVIMYERKHIIYNCVGKVFEKAQYNYESNKEYDFITIRNSLDGSKYAIDIVTQIASIHPHYRFCVIGKGNFFRYNKKPSNLDWVDKTLSHNEILDYLYRSRCALMPTRADAQGVMACEMATSGIPLITSNIEVCKEVFEGFKNVAFIDNDAENIDIEPILKKLESIGEIKKNEKYFAKNTVQKEIELFKTLKG